MPIANTDDEYGIVQKILHWVIAALILWLIPVGLNMGSIPNSPFKFEIYAMHKSFGLVVFFLGLLRLVWRFFSPVPDHLETHKPWETALASAAHFWLYVCIIGMPLTGWLMSSAGEFPVPFFGYQMPYLIGKDEHLSELFFQAHSILGYTLLFVLCLHMAGALKHHVIDKDETLKRMSWKKAGWGLVVAIVLYAGASYALSAGSFVQEILNPEAGESETAETSSAAVPANVDTSNLGENGWAIVPAQSKLTFKAMLYNAEFEGVFNDFGGTIRFNSDDLANSSADIRIGMKDITTGDADRDSNIKGEDWFDSDNHPDATFKTMQFERAEEGKYIAIGNLTIRGVTMPVSLPFTLDIQGDTAKMSGEVSLNRLDFRVGTGQWEDEKTVGHTVKVKIDLTAFSSNGKTDSQYRVRDESGQGNVEP